MVGVDACQRAINMGNTRSGKLLYRNLSHCDLLLAIHAESRLAIDERVLLISNVARTTDPHLTSMGR
jgi:hypothetical protein